MGSSEDFQAGICSGLAWWNNTGMNGLFSPCAGPPLSDFMYAAMDHQDETMKQQAQTAYSRSDDSDDHHSSSAEHLPVMSPDYAHIFQDSQKPLMADFGSSDWLQNSLLNDVSSNMAIFNNMVADDDLKSNNDNRQEGFYNLDQFDSNTKVSQMGGLGNNTIPSPYSYTPSMQQNLAGMETDMSYNFDDNFIVASSDRSFMQSSYQKQQQNPGSYNAASSSPFWNSSNWVGREPHQNLLPALLENQKPHGAMSTTIPKIETKNLSHKLIPNNSTVLGTKRSKNNNNASDIEVYKRPRIVTPSSLPTFKVRKEKLGDRITALQQLVSPFGKTDTASVLHEAVEYIKFLHDQVSVLRTPYMQNGTPINQHQQMQGESKNSASSSEGPKQDLRSRGLCLVPISSTFPVANESTTTDFWTPTFGGTMTFR